MALDFDALRRAFHGPPLASPPDHLPTQEELLAEHERIRVRCRLDLGLDPVAEGVGEHGSLIGGLAKPLTIIHRPVERLLRLEPMPLEWFDYPEARRVWRGQGQDEIGFLERLISMYLAGFPNRPTAEEFSRWLRSPARNPRKEMALYNVFETIRPIDLSRLLGRAHLSVYEIARAIIVSEARAPETIRWLHQFAVSPKTKTASGARPVA